MKTTVAADGTYVVTLDIDGSLIMASPFNVNKSLYSVSSIIRNVDVDNISRDIFSAFGEVCNPALDPCVPSNPETDAWYEQHRAEAIEAVEKWRAETGRQFPRIYKIKITVETEEASEQEAAAFFRREDK